MQNNGKTFATVSLVLGIVTIVLTILSSFLLWLNFVSLVTGVVGIVLAVKGKKGLEATGEATSIATAGVALSIVGLVFAAIWFFTCTLCALCVASAVNSALDGSGVDVNDLSSALDELSSALN